MAAPLDPGDEPRPDVRGPVEVGVQCPWCWQFVGVVVDPDGGTSQRYIEDCEVCCNPMELAIRIGDDGIVTAAAERAQ